MCVLESELENQLGEFHIKMKGKNETSICLHPSLLPLIFSATQQQKSNFEENQLENVHAPQMIY